MQSKLHEADDVLRDIETEFLNLKNYYTGKQSDRIFNNNTWMIDKLESSLIAKSKPLLDILKEVKATHNPEGIPSLQFDAPINHCSNVIKLLQELHQLYKMHVHYSDIKLKLTYNMPRLNDELGHLRNRFMILKGNITRQKKFDEEDNLW